MLSELGITSTLTESFKVHIPPIRIHQGLNYNAIKLCHNKDDTEHSGECRDFEIETLVQLLRKCHIWAKPQTLCKAIKKGKKDSSYNSLPEYDIICLDHSYSGTREYKKEDPITYTTELADLLAFLDGSPDAQKYELSAIFFPILVQMYCKLVQSNFVCKARNLVKKYSCDVECYYRDELFRLLKIKNASEISSNDVVTTLKINKFVLHLSWKAYSVLRRHIKDPNQEHIKNILLEYLRVIIHTNTSNTKYSIAMNMFLNRKRSMYYDFGLIHKKAAIFSNEKFNSGDVVQFTKNILSNEYLGPIEITDSNASAIDSVFLVKQRKSKTSSYFRGRHEPVKQEDFNRSILPKIYYCTILDPYANAICAEISEDCTILAVGFADASIKVWSLISLKKKTSKFSKKHNEDIKSKHTSPRNMKDYTTKKPYILSGHKGPVYQCTFSTERTVLLSCSEDRTLRLWSLKCWQCLMIYKGHTFPVWGVCFSSLGYYFASCSFDKTARLWTIDSKIPIRIFTGHLSDVNCIQFHPNSNYVATGSCDLTVRLWDIRSGEVVRSMTGHLKAVFAIAFSSCGRYLVSGGLEPSVIVWDFLQGQLLTLLNCHGSRINTLRFSREGNILAMGDMSSRLLLWDFSKIINNNTASSSDLLRIANKHTDNVYLLKSYFSRRTPLLFLHFSMRNMLIAVGTYRNIKKIYESMN